MAYNSLFNNSEFGLDTSAQPKPIASINIVPYVDVMLVLLVIFMATAPLLNQGVIVDLPVTTGKLMDTKEQLPLIITVAADGRTYLNLNDDSSIALAPSDLQIKILAQLQRNPKRMVLIRGDKAARYDAVLQAMASLQAAGVNSVALETRPLES